MWVRPYQTQLRYRSIQLFGGVGFGIIVRDSEGLLIEVKALCYPHLVTPMLTEAMAIKEALSWID